MFFKFEQKILLRATKNLKFFLAWSLGPKVYPKILVCLYHVLPKIYVGSYVGNGRCFRFWNSAGVLVQPWIRIFMSKFEVFLICYRTRNTMTNFRIYVYFKNMYYFLWNFPKIFKFWEFSIFFFFWKFAGFTT